MINVQCMKYRRVEFTTAQQEAAIDSDVYLRGLGNPQVGCESTILGLSELHSEVQFKSLILTRKEDSHDGAVAQRLVV